MALSQVSTAYKKRVLLQEIRRRVGQMRSSEIDREYAAIENALEVRIRFIAERFSPRSRKAAPSRSRPPKRT